MPNILYKVKRIEQRSPNLCWWASAQMIAAYKNKTIQDPTLLKMVKNNQKMSGNCFFLNVAGFQAVSKQELPPAPKLSVVRDVRALAGLPKTEPKSFSTQLYNLLRKRGPLLTLISHSGNRRNPDHAIVVCGTNNTGNANIRNPARGATKLLLPFEQLQIIIAYECATAMMYLSPRP